MKNNVLIFIGVILSSFSFGQCDTTSLFEIGGDSKFIEKDNEENIVISWFSGSICGLRKYDLEGNLLSSKIVSNSSGSTNPRILDVAFDSQNNIYLCGFFYTNLDLGNGYNFSCPGVSASVFVAKLDPQMSTLWARVSDGPSSASANGNDRMLSLSVDTLGSCYVSGLFEGNFTFMGHDLSITLGDDKLFHARFNSENGNLVWINTRPNPNYYDLTLSLIKATNSGGFYQLGNFKNSFTDDNSQLHISYPPGTANGIVQKYDSLGILEWTQQIRGENKLDAIQLDESQNLVVLGEIGDTVTIHNDTITDVDSRGLFIGRFDQNGLAFGFEKIASSPASNEIVIREHDFHYSNDSYFVSGFSEMDVNFNGLTTDHTNIDYAYFIAHFNNQNTPVWARSLGENQNNITSGVRQIGECGLYFYNHHYSDCTILPGIDLNGDFGYILELNSFTGLENIISDTLIENGISFNELSSKIYITPNPAQNSLNIHIPDNLHFKYHIMDVQNRIIMSGSDKLINLSDELNSGTYFIRIDTQNGTVNHKFLKIN